MIKQSMVAFLRNELWSKWRRRAVLRLALSTGARRAELQTLWIKDFKIETGDGRYCVYFCAAGRRADVHVSKAGTSGGCGACWESRSQLRLRKAAAAVLRPLATFTSHKPQGR